MKRYLTSILFMLFVFAGFGNYESVYAQENAVKGYVGLSSTGLNNSGFVGKTTNSVTLGADGVYGNEYIKAVSEFNYTPTVFSFGSLKVNSIDYTLKGRVYPIELGKIKPFAEAGFNVNRLHSNTGSTLRTTNGVFGGGVNVADRFIGFYNYLPKTDDNQRRQHKIGTDIYFAPERKYAPFTKFSYTSDPILGNGIKVGAGLNFNL